jgi:2-polyprenyl-6-methoxyphenol hydroxylase-like FAD-dependent oxidoreductase
MDAQVIVVGAGPVGLMLAAELKLGGADVLVLERLAKPMTESRASTLHARTMEILDQRGLLERLGTPPSTGMGHFGGLTLDLTHLATPYPGQWKVPQSRVEHLLGDWADELGARVRRGFELQRMAVSDDHVEVRGLAGAPRLRSAYVVGCDGEQSTVRRLAGIGSSGRTAEKGLLRADVRGIDVPDRRFERLPRGLAIAARGLDDVTRIMLHEYGRVAPEASFENLARAWLEVTGEDISGGTPVWVNAFSNVSLLADRYRSGRVLLAGDAAHQQLPAGGQAINLGLHDAVNLGWKLAADVTGRAPLGLLDSYHDERHPIGRHTLDNIEAQTLLLLGGREVDAARRTMAELIALPSVRDTLAATISGLDIRYGEACPDEHPLVGRRVPPVEIETALGRTKVTELLRTGRGLLLDLSGGTEAALDEALPVNLERVNAKGISDGPLAGVRRLLVRPDGHVAWVAGGAIELSSALQTWFCPAQGVRKGSASPRATAQIQHLTSIKKERG